MAPNPRRIDARLEELYARLPKIECAGHCHDSCGPIEMSLRERQRIEATAGPVTCGKGPSCSMLTADRRCGVYAIRPLICRLWGLTEALKCPYGCVPERYLTNGEAAQLLLEADKIGGLPSGREERLTEQMLAALGDDGMMEMLNDIVGKMAVRPHLAGRNVPPSAIDVSTSNP